MKICITSQGANLDSAVDPRFGRCKYFIFVDSENLDFEAVQNSNADAMGGAGIQSGQLVAKKEAQVVLTGNVGPNAFETLRTAGIDVVTGVSGHVNEAVNKYKKGELKPVDEPTVNSEFGLRGREMEEAR